MININYYKFDYGTIKSWDTWSIKEILILENTCWNIYLVLVFHMNWHIFPFFKIIIIKQVRSNTLGAVGFLGDSRRINVAITRARKHLALVCDSSTICHNTFLARLLRHIRHFGRVKHAEPGSFGGYGLGMNPILPSIN